MTNRFDLATELWETKMVCVVYKGLSCVVARTDGGDLSSQEALQQAVVLLEALTEEADKAELWRAFATQSDDIKLVPVRGMGHRAAVAFRIHDSEEYALRECSVTAS